MSVTDQNVPAAPAEEAAGGESEQGVDIAVVQESAANRFAGTGLEQHVVGDYYRGRAADLEQANDVLDEVKLLVLGRSPEVLSFIAVG